MDNTQTFFLGFIVAGVLGLLASWVQRSWVTMDRTSKRMFNNPPRPALRPIPGSRNRSVGTEPEQSPIQVLSQGCTTIIGQWLLQGMLFVALGAVIWFSLQQELVTNCLAGIIFAAVIGFLLQQLRYQWKTVTQLYTIITRPPVQSLTLERDRPPNNFYTSASLPLPPSAPRPPAPPFAVVVNGSLELAGRSLWLLILLYLLYRALLAMYFYLSDNVEQIFGGGFWGTQG